MGKIEVLYVVTTGLPGPGAGAYVLEALEAQAGVPVRPHDAKALAVMAAAGRACEFVELETADGKGRGDSTGVDWEDHPKTAAEAPLHRLGPFVSLKAHQAALAEASDQSFVTIYREDGLSVTVTIDETPYGPLLKLSPGVGTSLEGAMPGEYYLVRSPQIGPVQCPSCGWDDHGKLRIVDWYADEMPPVPRGGGSTLVLQGDDNEIPVNHSIEECGMCAIALSVESVVPRAES